jgi:hypothetical protein
MKPLGRFLIITSTDTRSASVDDDYDWHVRSTQRRHAAAGAAAAGPRRRPSARSVAQRIAAIVRLPRWRSGATNAPQA